MCWRYVLNDNIQDWAIVLVSTVEKLLVGNGCNSLNKLIALFIDINVIFSDLLNTFRNYQNRWNIEEICENSWNSQRTVVHWISFWHHYPPSSILSISSAQVCLTCWGHRSRRERSGLQKRHRSVDGNPARSNYYLHACKSNSFNSTTSNKVNKWMMWRF